MLAGQSTEALDLGSIRRVPDPDRAVATAMSVGVDDVLNVRTSRVSGSIREIVLSSASSTQIAAVPDATFAGLSRGNARRPRRLGIERDRPGYDRIVSAARALVDPLRARLAAADQRPRATIGEDAATPGRARGGAALAARAAASQDRVRGSAFEAAGATRSARGRAPRLAPGGPPGRPGAPRPAGPTGTART